MIIGVRRSVCVGVSLRGEGCGPAYKFPSDNNFKGQRCSRKGR